MCLINDIELISKNKKAKSKMFSFSSAHVFHQFSGVRKLQPTVADLFIHSKRIYKAKHFLGALWWTNWHSLLGAFGLGSNFTDAEQQATETKKMMCMGFSSTVAPWWITDEDESNVRNGKKTAILLCSWSFYFYFQVRYVFFMLNANSCFTLKQL